jgi:hypothetical protein
MKRSILALFVIATVFSSGFAQSKAERETIAYSIKDGQELLLDKYVDNSIEYDGKRPVMIYVHGGGFSTGSRINALQIKYCKHFTSRGFMSFSIDYRLGIKEGVQPDQATTMHAVSIACEDLIDATAFILEKADEWNIDTEKIIISGGSAGAITCLHAEYEICAEREHANHLPEGFNFAGVISHAGCIIVPQDSLEWNKAPCPILLMHGSADQLVPFDAMHDPGIIYAGSNYLHQQFARLNYSHWFYDESGADHIVALKPLQYNFGEIDTFIDKFIMKGKPAVVHTVWADDKPDSMTEMFEVVPLYITGWDKTDEEVEMQNQ